MKIQEVVSGNHGLWWLQHYMLWHHDQTTRRNTSPNHPQLLISNSAILNRHQQSKKKKLTYGCACNTLHPSSPSSIRNEVLSTCYQPSWPRINPDATISWLSIMTIKWPSNNHPSSSHHPWQHQKPTISRSFWWLHLHPTTPASSSMPCCGKTTENCDWFGCCTTWAPATTCNTSWAPLATVRQPWC